MSNHKKGQLFEKALGKYTILCLVLVSAIADANVLGVSYQNFFPSPSQTDYITVHSTESIRAHKWRGHFYGSFSGNNLFAYDVPTTEQTQHSISDQLVAAQLGFAYGITSELEFGMGIPMNIAHTIDPESDRGYIAQRWVTMVHNQFKYVYQRRGEASSDTPGMAVVASLDLPNTRQDGFLGQRQTPIVAVEGVYDFGNESESYSFNAGYRIRSPGEAYADSPVLPLQDQLLVSAAYQKRFTKFPQYHWIAEFYGAYPIDKGAYARAKDISSAEAIFGVRGSRTKSNRWTVGGGTGILKGTMSPDWRIFAGASWDFSWTRAKKDDDLLLDQTTIHGVADDISDPMSTIEPSAPLIEDSDLDTIPDDDDMCPRTPRGIKVDREGCPFDRDDDSIPDYEDRCPNTPKGEVVDSTGCPALR